MGSRTPNSHILFRLPQKDASESLAHPEPGQITDIFLHSQVSAPVPDHLSIYLCIRPYVPLHLEPSDVNKSYRQFGFAGGFLSEQALGMPIVVDHSSVISHIAVTPLEVWGYKVLHVLPMDKVGFHLY